MDAAAGGVHNLIQNRLEERLGHDLALARVDGDAGNLAATLDSAESARVAPALVALEQRGMLDGVVTQNIDRLHRRVRAAGAPQAVEERFEREVDPDGIVNELLAQVPIAEATGSPAPAAR